MAELPTPPNEAAKSQSSSFHREPQLVESYEEEQPTASHELADADQEVKGEAQIDHGDLEVKNLGWNEGKDEVSEPLVGRMPNEDLWTLIRRFNKQVFHVKAIPNPPLADLDLNIADDEEFSPDKLRAHLERFYMTIVVGAFSVWKHVARLRSWREWKRTAAFLGVYTAAWAFNLLIPTLLAFLITLVVYPRSRTLCFPHAPPSLIDSKTGGIQTPSAGVLGSDDSVTGAPEKHRGEAVEQEAHSFVNSISSLVVSTATGKHPQGDPHEDTAPDPTAIADDAANAQRNAKGDKVTKKHDKTKEPVSEAVWRQARPVMHMLADFTDTYERLGNALSPTPPFPREKPKLKLAAVLLPMMLGSVFLTSHMMIKGTGFAIGFIFFGDPIIQPTMALINRTYPHWQKYVELRNTILKGVPTNAQLTITLLRIGERNKAPLPPPPSSTIPPPTEAHATAGQDLDHLDATEEEISEAVHPDEETLADDRDDKPKKKSNKIVAFIKGTTKSGVQTALGIDRAKAAAGAPHAKQRLGAIKSAPNPATGPVRFPARYKGKKGHAYITVTATTPALSWTSDIEDLNPAWTVSLGDVTELKKVGGLGWKSKIVVGWAMEKEIADGLVVKEREGHEWHLTSILERDELFNRLVAMGNQIWEAW